MEIITHSREETVAAGREFAKTLPGGALIAFTGGLGAGKTAFCQGLAEGQNKHPCRVGHMRHRPRFSVLRRYKQQDDVSVRRHVQLGKQRLGGLAQ